MKQKKRRQKKQPLLYAFVSVLVVLAIYSGIRGFIYYKNVWKPNIYVKTGQKKFLLIYENDRFDDVLKNMEASGCVKNMHSFIAAAKKQDYPENIVPGRYELVDGMSNYKLIRYLINGRQTPIRITFNNIRTKENLAKRLSVQLQMDSAEMLHALNDQKLLEEYGLTPATSICLFIPNTYEVYWNILPEKLLRRMKKEYDAFWAEDRLMKLDEVGLNQIEVSTLASIVEEESNKKDEKAIIAGLYLNRIHKGMLLQADPTVKFAVQDFSLRRISGLLSYDSPYNTYKYAGLPPGPIRIPSMESIDAVLNYQNHNAIYMCAKEDLSGYHNFAVSFEEHRKNAERYRRALNRRGIMQ